MPYRREAEDYDAVTRARDAGATRRRRRCARARAISSLDHPHTVAWLIGRQTILLLVAGFAVGPVILAWLAQPARAVLFGVEPFDPITYAAVAAILTVVVCAAVVVPIRRAMTVDPIIALRAE